MKQRRFALTSVCLVLAWLWLFGAAGLPFVSAQDPPLYTYDVLSGIQPGEDGTTGTYEAADATLTQGWHYWQENAIDVGSSPAGTSVYAAIRAIELGEEITAWVSWDVNANGCEYVSVKLIQVTANSREDLGEIHYLHTRRSSDLQAGQTDLLPTTADAVAVTEIGTILNAPWIRVHVRNDDWSSKIIAEIDRRLADGVDDPLEKSDGLGDIQEVEVDEKTFKVRQMFGAWYERSWREALGESKPASTDGERCASTGPHLHQVAPSVDNSKLWRNKDSADNLDDDGFGFPVGQIDGLPYRVLSFCSDTWVFRLQSSQTAPLASPVQPCGAPAAAPANLTAAAGDGRIALSWGDPNDATITGYELRKRLSSPPQGTKKPWGEGWERISGSGAGTTSHTVPQLTNETAYTLQIRAVNANGYGPAGTVSATPSVETPTGVADPALKTLALSSASFTFDSTTTSYAVTVDDDLSRTTVTATPNNSNASLTIKPDDADPDTNAHEVDLAVGATTITVAVKHGGETRTYTVTVTRPDPLVAPVVTSFRASGTTLTGNFTWSGSSPRFLRWRLYQANSESGAYNAIGSAVEDSLTPVTYSGQTRDRWYKLRGRACEHRTAVGAQGANTGSRQATQLVTVCGAWSAYSGVVEIEAPPPPTCGARPPQHLRETETLSPTYAWTVAGNIASYIKTTVTRTRSRPGGVWQGHPTCAWKHDEWSDWKAQASTEVVRIETRPADQTRTVSTEGQTEWRVGSSQACQWTQYSDQPQAKRAEWSDDSESWVFGGGEDWVDNGDPSLRWVGPRNCEPRPADRTRTVSTEGQTEWRVGSSQACQWTQYSDQPQAKRAEWSDDSESWVFGGDEDWVDNGDPSLRWSGPRRCVAKPAPETVTVSEQQTRLGPPVFTGPSFCVRYPEKRSRSAYYRQPYAWDASATKWTLGERETTPYGYSAWTPWTRTGAPAQPCVFSSLPSGSWSLDSGDYELEWGAQRVLFTVPDDASVELNWRTRDSGGQEAVFAVAGEGELAVHPDSLGASSGSASGESSERPTLDAIEDSLTLVEADAD